MTPALLSFFEEEEAYHIESTGRELAIFKAYSRRATFHEVENVLSFCERLVKLLVVQPTWIRSVPALAGVGAIPD